MQIIGGTIFGGMFTDMSFLYPFTSFTFTSNIVGQSGPTLANLQVLYSNTGNSWISSTNYFTVLSTWQGYQIWTVPSTGLYQITAAGSRSGLISAFTGNTTYGNAHGRGAIIRGVFSLTQGDQLTIVSGQPSANTTQSSSYSSPGGGGGSFVAKGNIATGFANVTPLIIAGGGGAPGAWTSNSNIFVGGYGVTTKRGGNSAGYVGSAIISGRSGAPGGINGLGGNTHVNISGSVSLNTYDSGGGGGWSGNGINWTTTSTWSTDSALVNAAYGAGGRAFLYGAVGGIYSTSYPAPSTSYGGFGGGSGSGPITGGAGGGYSGGGGGYGGASPTVDSGGGGGSYIDANVISIATSDGQFDSSSTFNGIVITNLGSYNNAAGYINILKL